MLPTLVAAVEITQWTESALFTNIPPTTTTTSIAVAAAWEQLNVGFESNFPYIWVFFFCLCATASLHSCPLYWTGAELPPIKHVTKYWLNQFRSVTALSSLAAGSSDNVSSANSWPVTVPFLWTDLADDTNWISDSRLGSTVTGEDGFAVCRNNRKFTLTSNACTLLPLMAWFWLVIYVLDRLCSWQS